MNAQRPCDVTGWVIRSGTRVQAADGAPLGTVVAVAPTHLLVEERPGVAGDPNRFSLSQDAGRLRPDGIFTLDRPVNKVQAPWRQGAFRPQNMGRRDRQQRCRLLRQ